MQLISRVGRSCKIHTFQLKIHIDPLTNIPGSCYRGPTVYPWGIKRISASFDREKGVIEATLKLLSGDYVAGGLCSVEVCCHDRLSEEASVSFSLMFGNSNSFLRTSNLHSIYTGKMYIQGNAKSILILLNALTGGFYQGQHTIASISTFFPFIFLLFAFLAIALYSMDICIK